MVSWAIIWNPVRLDYELLVYASSIGREVSLQAEL